MCTLDLASLPFSTSASYDYCYYEIIAVFSAAIPWICFVWYITVLVVSCTGHFLMRRAYDSPPELPLSDNRDLPFVSVLRPVKGLDPNLDVCLASSCLIDYPSPKFEIIFSVASSSDKAIPAIKRVIAEHPKVNAKLFIGEENVGPNPKIRNVSRAYREAIGDILWILDCNVWVPPGILRRSVRLLEGNNTGVGYKLVHHLPLCIDVTRCRTSTPTLPPQPTHVSLEFSIHSPLIGDSLDVQNLSLLTWLLSIGGGRLEESFMSSAHAKFYWAINYLGVAPCIIGKSNLFRRSHLDEATAGPEEPNHGQGILYFAENICEDHLLAEKLWRTPLAEEIVNKRQWRKHGIATDIVFQPVENMSIIDYLQRRTRWIRVRKYAVIAATLAEPCTESILCSLIGSYGITSIPYFKCIIGDSWRAFWISWFASMLFWALTDRLLFNFLHQYKSTTLDDNSPPFVVRKTGRSLMAWALQWLARESLTFGVWTWAMWPGDVHWRGGRYKVGWKNMKVKEIDRDGYKRD